MEHELASTLVTSLLQSAEKAPGNLELMYGGAMLAMVAIVIGVYFNRGPVIIGRVLAYLLALSTMTLTVKSLFVNHQFHFPKFVSVTHFMSGGLLCFGIMYYRRCTQGTPIPVPTMKQQTSMILPISVAFASSIGANNVALLYSNASFVEMVGAAAPLCVIGISLAMGKTFDLRLTWPVLLVIAGVCICAYGELKFSAAGFALIFFATFMRAVKATLQHALMDSDENKLDPIELLAWMCPPSIVVMGTWSILSEGLEPYVQLSGENWLTLVLAIGVTCVNACILNVANLFVLKDLGAVATQLAGQLKGILILLGGAAMLKEVIQSQQIAGYGFIVAGVALYNKMDKDFKAAQKAMSESAKPLEKTPLVK